jgi:hypothetical protein
MDAHGSLWITCAPDAPRAVACGPTGSAREPTLEEVAQALSDAGDEDEGYADGVMAALRLVSVQTLADLLARQIVGHIAPYCWVAAPDEDRVLARTGLPLTAMPDGDESDLLGGCIAVQSPHGTVMLVDFVGEDDEGSAIYARAVVVGRSEEWPSWDGSSRGLLGQHDPVVRRDPAAYDLYSAQGLPAPRWIALGYATGTASSVSLAEATRRNRC